MQEVQPSSRYATPPKETAFSSVLQPLSLQRFLKLSHLILMLMALLVGGSNLSAHAQTAYAPGGLIMHPTAFTPRHNSFFLYTAVFTSDERFTSTMYPTSLSYSPTDNLMVSAIVAYHQNAGLVTHTHTGLFAKYQIMPDSKSHPAVAVAYAYVPNDFQETSVVAVASHNFSQRGRRLVTLHLGAKWMKVPPYAQNQQDTAGFIGLEYPLSRQWKLFGETSTRMSFDTASVTSLGVMYQSPRGGVTLGFANAGRSKDLRFFFGVGYPFGG